ncbi:MULTISPECIES: twin-arginine translocase TatA/TatE family subunit [unclassified Flavobacterium]|jgi:sec-independent protein translocase protein TatA|uniref:Sec-independent protein translocase subunit TatA/TatB n=1 Tax=unclassified Flavobacterium TaxID=196869 RepID=UPI000C196B0B|nr:MULTISPECIES: twin-arginine translocase TatA/TatE family subunit [unclassified Flavobacterium]PIF61839.1 sec-independent protein translocase protein TatA [Flavobacterium sp. 11]WKL42937.1 twin-arginine translocase TatA/TatE family subunit [Flavobacterium sp. ZE23DGlu08]
MFGIGGGELIFIMFIVLMLFGSDKVPEIARTMGKAMAQLKHATNDIKSEIQKGAEANGFDTQTLTDLRGNITSHINKAKDDLLGDTSQISDITGNITSEINKAKDNLLGETTTQIETTKEAIEDVAGPIKRQM